MKKHLFIKKLLVLLVVLITCIPQMWAAHKASHCGFWDNGGIDLNWTLNGSSRKTVLNYNGIDGTYTGTLGTVTTSLTLSSTVVHIWRDYKYGNICSSTIYWELYKGSTKIDYGNYSPALWGSWSNGNGGNNTMTYSTSQDFLAKTTGPDNYTLRIYAKITGQNSDVEYGDPSYLGCGTEWWYNNNISNGYYSVTFTIPSKNLTVNGAANGNTVSGSVNGITKGTAYDITATPTTGYGFTGWTTSDTHITIADASSPSTTVTFNNYSANATVTANFAVEETHDVAVSYKCGSMTIKTGTTESGVGVTSTRSVTAPTIDHYRFSGWTKGTGVSIVTGTTSTPTITINSVEGEDEEDYYLIANYKHLTRYYFTNVSWEHVYAYMWDDDNKSKINATWPGVEITGKTKSEIACGTRYYYELDASVGDSALYDHIIFNEGSGEGKAKTGDLTIDGNADKLFVYGDTWYDLSDHSVAVTTPYSYMGSVSGGGTAKAYGCSAEITATPAEGYRFDSWEVTSGTAVIANASNATTTVTASTDATITANFTQEGIILFDNTMSQWKGDIYVYLFTRTDKDPWWKDQNGKNGPGAVPCEDGNGYLYNQYGKMTRIGSSDIYYFDYAALGLSGSSIKHVLFTKGDHHNSNGLYQTSAAYISDFDDNYTYRDFPMYIASKDWSTTNETGYHNSGYWKRYNVTNSGFDLRGTFNSWGADAYPFTSVTPNSNTFKTTVHLNAGTPEFKIYRCNLSALGNTGTMTASNHSGWEMTVTSNCKIEIPAGGDYEFTINMGTDHIYLSVEYPLLANDYRLLYTGRITTDGADDHQHPTQAIRHLTKADTTIYDTVSIFIDADYKGSLKMQKCIDPSANSGKGSWTDTITGISLTGATTTGIYSFVITQTTTAAGVRTASVAPLDENFKYDGPLYIRTDVADGGWEAYKEVENNILEYSDYSKSHSGYDYYHVHWAPTSKNLHFTIANDYSPSISDTMTNGASPFTFDALPYQASVRFMYNSETNKLDRAYLNGSSEEGEATYLILNAKNDSITETNGGAISKTDGINSTTFEDLGNWVYQKDLKAIPGTHVRLISNYYYNGSPHYQYFKGNSGTWNNSTTEQIIGGTGGAQTLRLVYDYKTNHLVSAWLAPTTGATPNLALYADVMIIREEQKDARQIYFTSTNKLTEVDTVYAVMQFNKYSLNNRNKTNTADSIRAEGLRNIYWISFPFDVKLNDVFGFGTYGTHWGIEYYDGADRAQKGYWADSEGFWKLVTPEERLSFVLKANVGYLLVLDLDLLDTDSKVWEYTDNASLYFPSKDKVGSIQTTNKTIPIDQEGYLCSIDRRTDKSVANVNKDRRIADSYWHVIGVPSYANKTRGSLPTSAPTAWTGDILYLYVWNGATGEYTVTSSATVDFKTMYSYMVQYSGKTISWTSVSATPDKQAVIARKMDRADYDLRLELRKGDQKEDQTYVHMTDNENVTNAFEFNYDLFKEMNGGKANIWTVTSDVVPAAGNVMPFSENTTTIPVGVKIATNGEYTFAIPEGTNGVGVTLIDNVTGTRTNLSALDYTINLNAGEYANRFFLEISPIKNVPTDLTPTLSQGEGGKARKVMIDGVLYIVKDGQVFDARGNKVK